MLDSIYSLDSIYNPLKSDNSNFKIDVSPKYLEDDNVLDKALKRILSDEKEFGLGKTLDILV